MKTILLQNTGTTVFTAVAFITIFFGSITTSFAEGVEGKGCGGHKGKMFEKMDTNGDGVMSHEEFSAKAEERFKMMDADSDRKITKEEAKNHHAAMRKKYKKHHGEN
jgi:hypothetical protein